MCGASSSAKTKTDPNDPPKLVNISGRLLVLVEYKD